MTPWRCPLCVALPTADEHTRALQIDSSSPISRSYRCGAGHCFDVAREGYVNLLPVQQKKSLSPGDTLESLQARRRFLAGGFYQPLRDALVELIAPCQTLIDLGCGEGYYSAALAQVAEQVIALDIAKPAIRLAAKTYPSLRCAVVSVAAVPLPDASADVVTSIFAPVPLTEIRRLLKPGGRAVVVTPAPAHLFAYREALFEEVRDHQPSKFADAASAHFQVLSQQEIRYEMCLDQAAINDLLEMTPYAYKASPERRACVSAQTTLRTEAAFSVLVLVKPLLDLDSTIA
jgi:23S rRNA (guanine745-N1)-methyltransferase